MFVKVSDEVDINLVHSKRVDYDVNYIPAIMCGPKSLKENKEFEYLNSYIRLSFSYLKVDELREAAKVFVSLIESCVKSN